MSEKAEPKVRLGAGGKRLPVPVDGHQASIERGKNSDADGARKPAAATWSTLWLVDRDLTIFTALASVVLVMLIARWVQLSGWGRDEVVIERLTPLEYSYRLDLNSATWVEFAQLDNVGESLAMRIVERREKVGPYRNVEELDEVSGIGPKTLDGMRPFVWVAPAKVEAQ